MNTSDPRPESFLKGFLKPRNIQQHPLVKIVLFSIIVFIYGCAAVDIAYLRRLPIDPLRDLSETLIATVEPSTWVKETVAVSPDGRRIAYVVKDGNKQYVEVNGKKGKRYDSIWWAIVFSPDSQRLAYIASQDGKQFVVVDDQEGKTYEGLGGARLVFSPDSKHLAFIVKENEKWFTVIDGKEGKKYDKLGTHMTFAPNNRDFAYVAMQWNPERGAEEWFVVLNDVEQPRCAGIIVGTPIFSPDGKHMAYGVRVGEEWSMVVDGVQGRSMPAWAHLFIAAIVKGLPMPLR